MSLKFWLHLPFFYPDLDRPYKELLDETVAMCKAAERLGFEGVVVPENNFHNFIVIPSSLQMISYLAPQTTTLKFQSGVLVLPMYHPLRLAGQVAFTSHMTEGRLSIGVARGGGPYQAERLGYNGGDMRAMYEESLGLLKRAWTEFDLSYEGEFWRFPESTVLPRLWNNEIPELWVAAQSRTGLFNAGRDGLNLLTASNASTFWGPEHELEEALTFYDEGLAESGAKRGRILINRSAWIDETVDAAMGHMGEIYRNWTYFAAGAPSKPNAKGEQLFLARDDPRSGWKRKDRPILAGRIQTDGVPALDLALCPERYDGPIVTDPAGAIEQFKQYEALGVTDVNLMMQFGAPIEQLIHSLEIISRDVMPAFADRTSNA